MPAPSQNMTQAEVDRLYDAFTALVDQAPAGEREKVLARLAIALAERVNNYGEVVAAIDGVAATLPR